MIALRSASWRWRGLVAVCALASTPAAAQMHSKKSIFAKENLLAWCIVPYDAAHRGPRERAEMLQRLGIHTLAYDWREEHVPSFEDEIVELIVYNFHHGHEHIRDFAESLAAMQPYLLCVNLNGMNASGTPKILPIGSGDSERKMIKILKQSGYSGPPRNPRPSRRNRRRGRSPAEPRGYEESARSDGRGRGE